MSDGDKRKRLKAHYAEFERVRVERDAIEQAHFEQLLSKWQIPPRRGGYPLPVLPDYPLFPDELRGMTCSARTRAGTPCKRVDLYANGRCKLHGGMSTGPRSIEGKARSAANGINPKRKRTP